MSDLKTLVKQKLGFGFMRLPVVGGDQSAIDLEKLRQMVDLYLERGFRYFDTAYVYHEGRSEDALRQAVVERYPRERFLLADKMPGWMVQSTGQYEEIFREQLARCGVSYFDFYLLHNLGEDSLALCERLGGFEFLRRVRDEGQAKYIGFSFHDKPELLDKILTDHPEIDFVQLQINYFDWDNPAIRSGACYEVACRHQKPVIVMEPVKGGGLAELPEDAEQVFEALDPHASGASYAIRFAASLDGVLLVLSGMNQLPQVEENTAYMSQFRPLSAAEHTAVGKVRDILGSSRRIQCTACRYCMGACPKNIPIPDLFGVYNFAIQFGDANFPGMHYARNTRGKGKAGDCIRCGRCEQHCPQHLSIRDLLAQVAARFERESE